MEEQKNNGNTTIHNHFAEGSNCQVFNAPISNAVFAMPGSHVTQVAAKADEQTKSEENDLVSLPPELQTEKARQLMESLVDAELLNEEWQPDGISNTEKALVAKMVADRLKINDVWQVFGKLWKMNPNSMRTYYNRAMDQRKSLEFQDRLKNILC